MSASTKPLMVACPTCKTPVAWLPEQTFRPFCSERCKLMDLGGWAMEANRIPGEPVASDDEDDGDPPVWQA